MKKILKDYLIIFIGAASIAFSINCLAIPNNLGEGGVPGLSTMGVYLFNIPASVSNLVLNAVIIILGYRYFSKSLILKTCLVVIISTIFLKFMMPIHLTVNSPIVAAILAGSFMGGGIGLVYLGNATSASGSMIAKVLEKKFKIKKSYGLLISDLSVIIPSSIFLGVNRTLLTIISVYVSSKVLYFIIESDLFAELRTIIER